MVDIHKYHKYKYIQTIHRAYYVTGLSRRTIITSACLSIVAGAGAALIPTLLNQKPTTKKTIASAKHTTILLSLCPPAHIIKPIAEQFRAHLHAIHNDPQIVETHPEQTKPYNTEGLIDILEESLTRTWPTAHNSKAENIANDEIYLRIYNQIRNDYETARWVNLQGWLLSRTEAELALLSVLVTIGNMNAIGSSS